MITQTENTKKIDEAFNFDLSKYQNSETKHQKYRISHKAICNNCGSEDCLIITVREDLLSEEGEN